MKSTLILTLAFLLVLAGCGGGSSSPIQQQQGKPIDPSGNWAMKFTDNSGNSFILSALFSQTGSVVTALNLLAAGNPAPFSCSPFTATFSNGQVLNVDQFSGDIAIPSGGIHFTSTLNAAGTHAAGTYTLVGTCWGVGPSGTFTADEIPSVSGTWSGSIICTSNCPLGSTTGTIMATLAQNDQTGVVAGTYATAGLPGISSGNVSTGQFDVLSGQFLQVSLVDANGNGYIMAGGPGGSTAGLGLDRSFNGRLIGKNSVLPASSPATYTVSMSH